MDGSLHKAMPLVVLAFPFLLFHWGLPWTGGGHTGSSGERRGIPGETTDERPHELCLNESLGLNLAISAC